MASFIIFIFHFNTAKAHLLYVTIKLVDYAKKFGQ